MNKRRFTLIAFIAMFAVIFLLPMGMVPTLNTTSGAPMTQDEIDHFGETLPNGTLHYPDFGFPTRSYLPSAEGTQHEDSILEFAETTPDDTLFYPDAFTEALVFPSSGDSGFSPVGTLDKTHVDDGDDYSARTSLSGDAWVTTNFTALAPIEYFYYNIEGWGAGGSTAFLYVYDWTADAWVSLNAVSTSTPTWYSGTLHDSDYWSGSEISLKIESFSAGINWAAMDYAAVTFTVMHLADSDHYAESFADVSDISVSAGSISTDGDVLSWEYEFTGDNQWIYLWSNAPSAMAQEMYREIRWQTNASLEYIRSYAYSADDRGGTSDYVQVESFLPATPWATYKGLQNYIASFDIECLAIGIRDDTGTKIKLELDYDRYGPATEMGWQHDGSTTAGVTDEGDAGYDYTFSSDGDVLTATVEQTAASDGFAHFYISYDTTTTTADISTVYYPYIVMRYQITTYSGVNRIVMLPNIGGKKPSAENKFLWATSTCSWTTLRGNLDAMTGGTAYKRIDFYVRTTGIGQTVTIQFEYIKFVSIANWTYTGSGVTTDDYLYTDSGVLYSHIDDGYIELDHDPALSVSDTYSVYNLTTSGTALQFSQYVSSWSTYSDDTRGATTSGTVTDIKLKFDSTETLSAIKFWEDGTAPTISTFTNTPLDPSTASTITIETISSDVCGVYTAKATAVVEPTGSNIGTVSMTLDYTTQSGAEIFSYTFSAGNLLEGRYTFELEVDDAANQAYEYLTFTVAQETQTKYIRIFDSLGDFVPFETFEVYRNGTRQYVDIFEGVNGYAYQIQVKDRWGETLNTTTFAAGVQELVVTVEVYSLKVMSWHDNFVRFNVTRAGLTYSEIVAPLEIINFRLYTNTYDWEIDFLNGTSTAGNIALTNSTALIVTGSTISDVLGLVTTVNEMTTAINITTTTISNEVVTIQLMFDWSNTTLYNQSINIIAAFNWDNTTLYNQTISIAAAFNATNTALYNQIILIQNMFNWENTTLFNQTISILNAFNSTNTVIYDQTISILSEISTMNATIYGQTVSLLNYLYYNSSSIYNQTIDMLTTLNLIGSNVTANYISVSASLVAIDSSLLANFTSVSAALILIDSNLLSNFTAVTSTLSAIGTNITANYLSVAATLSLMDSNLLSNFTSVSAALTLIDSNLLSNFTAVTSTLTAIGTNITTNYLSVTSTLSMIDSSLLSNYTQLTATLLSVNSTIGSQFITVSATLSLLDSSLLSNFTLVSATLSMLDSNLLSNFTSVTSTLSAIGSNVTTNFLSVTAALSLIDSSLLSNFTAITSTLTTIGSNITTNYLAVSATLSMLDSSLLSNFTSISATLLAIDSSLLSNFTSVTSTLSAIGSNVTANYLSVSAALTLIDSNLFSNFTSITASLSAIGSNVTSDYLSIVAELALIDSSLATNFTNIISQVLATNSSIVTQTLTIISNLDALNATVFLVDDPTHLNPLVLGHSYSDEYCDFTIVTNWHNASISVYDNDVLRTGPTSELLCPIRYPLLDTSGTHNLSVYVDAGSDSFWYNISYTIAEIIAFEIEDWDVTPHLSIENYLECFFDTTWGNSTIYVYLNGTLQASVLEQEGGISFSFWMSGLSGLHNYVFNVTSGANVKTITWDFYLPNWAETALVVRWDMWTYQNNYTLLTLESNWRNCTYHIYLDGAEVANATVDPVTLNFTRSINVGEYNLTIFADGGTQNYTILNIRYIVTEDGVTYDYSKVTTSHGVSNTYETNNYATYENPTGVYVGAETIALIIVGLLLGSIVFIHDCFKMACCMAGEIRSKSYIRRNEE